METSQNDPSAEGGGIEPTIPVGATEGGDDPAPALISTQPLDRGDSLGRYTVLERIGSGGMGVVYAAYDPQLDRRIALKVLHPGTDLEIGTSDGRGRLLREAQAMAKLSHPNVITVHDVGTLGDRVFVAMEFIDGTTLREWVKQGHREPTDIVEVYVKAGRGLAAAHAAGLVHRDFKPDNVLVGQDGRVQVMDFGLARQTATAPVVETTVSGERIEAMSQPHDLVLTRTGALLGTPAYMAPEQHKGAPADPLADQFSFCVSLYEALYGERPFDGTSVTSIAMAILEGHVRDAPRGTRVPGWLREVVVRGLSVQPEDRFASMDALLAELQRDPPQPKRPWLGIGIAAGVAGIITTGYLWTRPASEDRCKGAGDAIARSWNVERKRDLETRFAAVAGGSGEATAASVGGLLDAWGQRWIEAHEELCVASRVPGSGPITADEVAELRCLDVMQGQMHALVDVLAEPTLQTVERSVIATQHLPSPSRCGTRLRISESERGRPASSVIRDRIDDARRHLALGWAYTQVGQAEPAREAADAARRAARALDERGLEAEVELLVAAAHRESDRPAAAEQSLHAAILAAAQSGRAGLEAEAWTEMVGVVGHDLGRHGQGQRLGLAAEAAIARAGDDPELRASLEHAQGRVDLADGRWEDARAHFDRAHRARESADISSSTDLADTLLGLGLALDGLGRYAQAAGVQAEALAILERALGPRHRRVATALAHLGTAELGADSPMRADASFARARLILDPSADVATEAILPRDALALADVLDRASQVRRAEERYDDAAALERRALALLESIDGSSWRQAGYCRLNLGVVLADQGQHVEAAAELREALRIWGATLDPAHPDLGIAQLDLGNTLLALSEHEAAEQAYARALEIWHETLPDDHPLIAYALTGLGRCALATGEVDAAIEHLDRALELRDHDDEDKLNIAETSLMLARALWATGRDPVRALELVRRARDLSGAFEPTDDDGLRSVLDGVEVPRFTEQLAPAALGVTHRDLR